MLIPPNTSKLLMGGLPIITNLFTKVKIVQLDGVHEVLWNLLLSIISLRLTVHIIQVWVHMIQQKHKYLDS